MAITLTPTGAYPYDSAKGKQVSDGYANYSFCSALITAPAAYAADNSGDPSVLDFGVTLSQIVFVNTGNTAVAIQWKENWNSAPDNGVIPANSTVVLRKVPKRGVKVRGAEGGTGTVIVWGL